MSKAQGGLNIVAIVDGVTVNGYAKVFNTPLIQSFTKGSNKYVPDFEALSEAKKPVVVAFLTDATDGKVLIPRDIVFKYNGTALEFGIDNMCTTSGFIGTFKKLNDYAVTVGSDTSTTYPMPALQIVKNLVPISGYDNDIITISGRVESDSQLVNFTELATPVVVHESTGNQFDVIIEDDNGRCLDKVKNSITLKMTLYRDSVQVNDLSGFSIKWYKVSASGDIPMSSTSTTQVVTKADVDNKQVFRCDVAQGSSVKAQGFIEISDYSDNYLVDFNLTDTTGAASGTSLRKGQSLKVAPVAVSRESGNVVQFKECAFRTRDNAGKDFVLTGKSSASFTISSPTKIEVIIPYNDVKRAGYGMHLIVEGTI